MKHDVLPAFQTHRIKGKCSKTQVEQVIKLEGKRDQMKVQMMFYSLYFPLNHKVRVNGKHEVTKEDIEENLDPVKTEQSQQRWVRFSVSTWLDH